MEIPGYRGNLTWLGERTILLTKHGSHAYGTNTPESDLDLKGVAIPPKNYLLGVYQRFDQAETKEPDMVIYDLRKFVQLAADNNPNILEVLFTEREDYVGVTPVGERLLAVRELFLSKKAKFTFSGYAMAQLRRLRTHYRWVKDPPAAPPPRSAMGLGELPLGEDAIITAALSEIERVVGSWEVDLSMLPIEQQESLREQITRALAERVATERGAWDAATRLLRLDENLIERLKKEREYRGAVREYEQFLQWKKARNPKRAALEARFGYDTKFGMHVVRLFRMARELLETGTLKVKRADREELLAIRNGAWSFEQLDEWAAKQDAELEEVYKRSTLRHSPERHRIDLLCVELLEESLRW